MKLNLGSGRKPLKGYVNCDIIKTKEVDKVFDLDKRFPFKTNSIDEIFCENTIEHLNNPVEFLNECWRVSKGNAIIKIIAPHTSNIALYGGLTHKRTGINTTSFNAFLKENKYNYYTKARFEIISFEYELPNMIAHSYWSLKIKYWLYNPIKRTIERFLPKHLRLTEYYLANIMNLGRLKVKLKVIK